MSGQQSKTETQASKESSVARVIVVDDHPVVRKGLVEMLDQEPDLKLCGEADDPPVALRLVESSAPDFAIIDISLKEGSGLELIKQIKAMAPKVRMLALSMHDETLYAERAMRAGAMGYLNKQEPPQVILEAVRRILAGKVYVSEKMANRVLHRVVEGDTALADSPVSRLSDRELQVFERIGQGLSTRDIADHLHLSVKTVETHRDSIKAKLNLKNSTELTRHAVQWVLENAG